MGVDSFKGLAFGFILFTTFSFFLLTFVDQMSDLNEVSTASIGLDAGALNSSIFNNSLIPMADDAETLRQRQEASDNTVIDISITGINKIFEDVIDFIQTPFVLMAQIMENILGIPKLFSSIILTIITLTFVLAIWRLLKIGD